jgi:hypothetical protein
MPTQPEFISANAIFNLNNRIKLYLLQGMSQMALFQLLFTKISMNQIITPDLPGLKLKKLSVPK